MGLVGIGLVLLCMLAHRRFSWLAALSVSLQLSGAPGNLFDRAGRGGVTDLLVLGAGPVFNVADVALAFETIGAVWALSRSMFSPAPGVGSSLEG